MRTRLIYLTIAAWMVASVASSSTPAMRSTRAWEFKIAMSCPGHKEGIAYYRGQAHRYEARLGLSRTPAVKGERVVGSCEEAIPVVSRWRNLASQRAKQYVNYQKAIRLTGIPAGRPPHYDQWNCIHRFEGAWNDPNAPYYGGLQMDLGFQRTYGGKLLALKGTADHWTPLEQMWVAEKAYASGRGFGPWPNTARYCGLL